MPDLRIIDSSSLGLVHDLIGGLFGFTDDELVGLLAPSWSDPDEPAGWILVDGGRAVGFLGAVRCRRLIGGEEHRFCNLTTWYVEPEHRGSSLAMLRPLARSTGEIITDFSPSADAVAISTRLGFEEIDTASRLFEPHGSRASSLVIHRGDLRALALLGPGERRIVSDHRWIPTCRWYVASEGPDACLIVGTRSDAHRRPYLRLDHVSNPGLFLEHADGIVAAMQRAEHVRTVFAGNRFRWSRGARCARLLPDRTVALALHREGLEPEQIDNLYSEVMLLDITTLPHSIPSTRSYQLRQFGRLATWRMRQVKHAGHRFMSRRS